MDAPSFNPTVYDVDPNFKPMRERVRFYSEPMQRKNEAGNLAWVDVPHVEVQFPGWKKPNTFRANDDHKKRWPRAWQAFVENKEPTHEGQPLSTWPGVTPAQLKQLEMSGVYTLEQLASFDEHEAKTLGSFLQDVIRKAKLTINQRSGIEAISTLQNAFEKEKARNELLQRQMAEIMEKLNANGDESPKKKGGRTGKAITTETNEETK